MANKYKVKGQGLKGIMNGEYVQGERSKVKGQGLKGRYLG